MTSGHKTPSWFHRWVTSFTPSRVHRWVTTFTWLLDLKHATESTGMQQSPQVSHHSYMTAGHNDSSKFHRWVTTFTWPLDIRHNRFLRWVATLTWSLDMLIYMPIQRQTTHTHTHIYTQIRTLTFTHTHTHSRMHARAHTHNLPSVQHFYRSFNFLQSLCIWSWHCSPSSPTFIHLPSPPSPLLPVPNKLYGFCGC